MAIVIGSFSLYSKRSPTSRAAAAEGTENAPPPTPAPPNIAAPRPAPAPLRPAPAPSPAPLPNARPLPAFREPELLETDADSVLITPADAVTSTVCATLPTWSRTSCCSTPPPDAAIPLIAAVWNPAAPTSMRNSPSGSTTNSYTPLPSAMESPTSLPLASDTFTCAPGTAPPFGSVTRPVNRAPPGINVDWYV